jgi:Domain of unknown function (DUF5668)
MNGYNVSLLRAIRGPVLLVTLGALFLIDHSGGISFGRTWPVLLIVLGILRLGEYMGAKSA